MLNISVAHNIDEAMKSLDASVRKQVPFATALALTRTAQSIQKQARADMQAQFDRPTRYTLNSMFVKPAKKDDLVAIAGVKDQGAGGGRAPARWLAAQFGGGTRGDKGIERALMGMGALPRGWRIAPGAGAKLDRYGNIDRKTLAEVLGALKSGMSVFSGRGVKRRATIGYFVVPPSRTQQTAHFQQPGVYRRIYRNAGDREAVPVLVFVQGATYRQRIDLRRIGEREVRETFPREFSVAFDRALATAR